MSDDKPHFSQVFNPGILLLVFVLTCSLNAAISPRASGELVARDLVLGSGDQLVTRDTATGLDWLDLTLTTVSYNGIVAGWGGWIEQGWRHAKPPEVEQLLSYAYCDGNCPPGELDPSMVLQMIRLLGMTEDSTETANGIRSYGAFDDQTGGDRVGYVALIHGSFNIPGGIGVFMAPDWYEADGDAGTHLVGNLLVHASPECDDGLDNDADELVDFPADSGCGGGRYTAREDPECQDGVNNDNSAGIDFDGGASLDLDDDGFIDAVFNPDTPAVGEPDPDCRGQAHRSRERWSCGLGSELAFLLPPLLWLQQRRRVARA